MCSRAAFVASCFVAVATIGVAHAQPAPPAVEILGFGGNGHADSTRLWALSPSRVPRELGRIHHRPGSSVKGVLLEGRRVVAVADRDSTLARERSWTGGLYVVAGGKTEALVGDVYEGSWPVAVDATHVLVARGEAGPVVGEEQRIDAVFVDRVDVVGQKVKRLYQSHGYLALPIGVYRGTTYVADYGPAGAAVVAIDASGNARVLADGLLLARDFSLDGDRNAIYAEVRHPEQRDGWRAIAIDLATGRQRTLIDGDHYALLPHRWPSGAQLAVNPTADGGLRLYSFDTGRVTRPPFGFGPGVDEIAAVGADGRSVAILHHAPRGLATSLWLVDASTNRPFGVALPPKERRFEVVGVVAAEGTP